MTTNTDTIKAGSLESQATSFRDKVKPGGRFQPEAGRYHLYVSYACPWAHRTLILRHLKGLDNILPVSVFHPSMGNKGWRFPTPVSEEAGGEGPGPFDGSTEDPLFGAKGIREIYYKANSDYNARFSVPILWDKQLHTIVNNESAEIVRILNSGFNSILLQEQAELDLYPEKLRAEIDELNDWVFNTINTGVYKAGFATSTSAYSAAVHPLFDSLDRLEHEVLADGREFLVGGRLTEADVRLYTTVVRFDVVYHGLFKCNLGSIRHDCPNINRWLKNLYWKHPAFHETTKFDHIKSGYYGSMKQLNPNAIVPLGPREDVEKV